MGLKLKQILQYEIKPIKEYLKPDTLIAIDLTPLVYKYYFLGLSSENLGSLRITSHIYGVLKMLKKIRSYGVTPILCWDILSSDLKQETKEKRLEQIQKNISNTKLDLQRKENNLSFNERKLRLTLSAGPSETDKNELLNILYLAGYSVYAQPRMEAEKLCAYLKKQNLVDYCYSPDSDVCLYGVDCISNFNFYNNEDVTIMKTNKTLEKYELSLDQLIDIAIASGTDFSKGLPNIGVKKALKKIKENRSEFKDILKAEVQNYERIYEYFINLQPKILKEELSSIRSCKIEPTKENITILENKLRSLNFSENSLKALL